MKLFQTLLSAAALCCFAYTASAQTTFFFHNDADTIGTGADFSGNAGSVQDTQGPFTITAEAFLDGTSVGNPFNGAGDGFGINAAGTGDETQRFDNDNGIESMVFSFNIGGTFQSLDLQFIEELTNEALLIFDGGTTYQLNTTNANSGADDFTINEVFTAGQSITLTMSGLAPAGENFSLQSFTVVPEPATYALLGGILAFAFTAMRRRM